MRRWKLITGICALVVALVGGVFLLSGSSGSARADLSVQAGTRPGNGPLDGLRFVGGLGPVGDPLDIEDALAFSDGLFVSEECERICNYPASPYYIRRHGERIDFMSETRCPHKNATIVWRGTVEDDTLTGEATWTTHRWYWTVERTFRFEGKLDEASPAADRG